MPQTDSLGIVHVKHIDKDRLLHGVDRFGVEAELLCIVDEVLFVGLLLFGQFILPQVAQSVRAVVALYDLTASVHCRCAGVGRSTAGDFLRTDALCHFFGGKHRYGLGTVLGLRFLNKEHGVALSLYVRGL